ncbi:MAG: hypothetical protein ABR571_03070 [Jatrophihabitans sp.]|uniref:hypothetical protein n=1 Tax=Jatrophihabitans sp. TaxID=1932789 RepID=UPI0039112B53
MIQGAVFCPHPPLLIPQVAQGAAPELGDLRAACRTAIRRVATGARIVVVGAGPRWTAHGPTARGTLAGFGVPLEVPLGSDAPGAVELPPSLTVGAWLLRNALGPDTGATGWSVGPDDKWPSPLVPADTGPYVLLVMGDGSARRSTSAPGYLDDRAAGFDADVAAALASGEGDRLHLDRKLGAELLADGARAWDAAAGQLEPFEFDAEVLYDAAPYGVGYFVAAWTRAG